MSEVIACLMVNHDRAYEWCGSDRGFQLAYKRLQAARGVDIVLCPIVTDTAAERLEKELKKIGVSTKPMVVPHGGVRETLLFMREQGLVGVGDRVIFDRGLTPLADTPLLEACLEQLEPDNIAAAFPARDVNALIRLPGGAKLMQVQQLNTTLGAYRVNSVLTEIAVVPTSHYAMLQMDRDEDMNIAQALQTFGLDVH